MKLQIAVIAVLVGFGALVCADELKIDTTEVGGRLVDDINLPFVNDPEIIGEWNSVDIVDEPGQFVPGTRRFTDPLYLKGIIFRAEGWMTGLSVTWTKGVILDDADKTASRYSIKELDGAKYMFMEWKSGDYTIRHQKPCYYVLKKK